MNILYSYTIGYYKLYCFRNRITWEIEDWYKDYPGFLDVLRESGLRYTTWENRRSTWSAFADMCDRFGVPDNGIRESLWGQYDYYLMQMKEPPYWVM